MCSGPQSHFWLIQVSHILWSFSVLPIVGLCARWTNVSRAVLWGCHFLTEYPVVTLCLCYEHCCLVISHEMQLRNQNSLNFADLCFCERSTESPSIFFALHPNGQKFSLHGHLPSHARGPSMIQTKDQDSLFSLMDPWISIPLEPRDKASPHLKWVFYNIDESILIYLRTRI